jgi:ribosomal protein S18 acetylase RimI-like enzyme
MNILFQEIGMDQIDAIRPLWEKLRAYHVALTPQFAAQRAARTFETRKQELLAKSASGTLKIDLAGADSSSQPVAYCITSLGPDGAEEIDSLFVEQDYRGRGIGAELTRRALTWLDGHKATSKTVVVAFGNDPALAFYARFGFLADCISLRQVPKAGGRSGPMVG